LRFSSVGNGAVDMLGILSFSLRIVLNVLGVWAREEAIAIIRKVNASKGRRRWLPPSEKEIMGLCDWGLRTQILHPRDRLRKCEFFGKKPSRA